MGHPAVHIISINGVHWTRQHARATTDHLGFIPEFLAEDCPDSTIEQIQENYVGGWDDFKGPTLDPVSFALLYPGDPPNPVLWWASLPTGETIRVYDSAFVAVTDKDGNTRFARLDYARHPG